MGKAAVIEEYLNERFGPGAVGAVRLASGRQGTNTLVIEGPCPELEGAWESFDEFCGFWDGAPPSVLEAVENVSAVKFREVF
jgi:hypothetical protein